MLVECKRAKEDLNQEALNQAIRYNNVIQAKYVVLTNGIKNYCCQFNPAKGEYEFLKEIPEYRN